MDGRGTLLSWICLFLQCLIANALKLSTTLEVIYYGGMDLNLFFDSIDHAKRVSRISLSRLLTNRAFPLQSIYTYRDIDAYEADQLFWSYKDDAMDYLSIFVPFHFLLQHQKLASMVVDGRNSYGVGYYKLSVIDLPATAVGMDIELATLRAILHPHRHDYWMFRNQRTAELLLLAGGFDDAWDICDRPVPSGTGHSISTAQQQGLAGMGTIFRKFIVENNVGYDYSSLFRQDRGDKELVQLCYFEKDYLYYDRLSKRIEQYTEAGSTRRTLWKAKLLLMALRILNDNGTTLRFPSADPRSPVHLISSFMRRHDVKQLPEFYLDHLIQFIGTLGVSKKLLLVSELRPAMEYMKGLTVAHPVPWAGLSQHIWRWRSLLRDPGFQSGDCLGVPSKFYSSAFLLEWWGDYTRLSDCLLMNPNIGRTTLHFTHPPRTISRLKTLLGVISKALGTNSSLFVSMGSGTPSRQKTIARTIAANVLYRGKLGLNLESGIRACLLPKPGKSLSFYQVGIHRLLKQVFFQEAIPIASLPPIRSKR